jgi:cytochrome c biogenesis protein CcdA
MDAPYALALAAGMLATVNPCGFALLPTYVSLLVVAGPAGDQPAAVPPSRLTTLGRALGTTAAITGGFVVVFGIFGLLVTPLALSLDHYLPWATMAIGVVLAGLGIWLLSGREIFLATPKLRSGRPTRSLRSMALYGASYAIASLSCTIGPFLALTTAAFGSSNLLGGLGVFTAYALGMGLVVGVLTLATALAREALVTSLRRILPYVSRIGGLLLLFAGAYVAYYGWYETKVLSGSVSGDPVVDAVVHAQAAVMRGLDQIGPARLAVVFLSLTAVGLVAGFLRAHRSGSAAANVMVPDAPRREFETPRS